MPGHPSVFVGGLSAPLDTEEGLREFFTPYGEISSVKHFGSYAFINFAHPDSGPAAAAAMNQASFTAADGRQRQVAVRVQDEENKRQHQKKPAGVPAGVPAGAVPTGMYPPGAMSMPPMPPSANCPTVDSFGRPYPIFVGGFGRSCEPAELQTHLAALAHDYGQCVITAKQGFGFIQFDDVASANTLLMNYPTGQVTWGDRTLSIRLQTPQNRMETTKIGMERPQDQGAPKRAAPPPGGASSSSEELFIGGFGQDADPVQVRSAVENLCTPYGVPVSIVVRAGFCIVTFWEDGVASRVAQEFAQGADWSGRLLAFRAQPKGGVGAAPSGQQGAAGRQLSLMPPATGRIAGGTPKQPPGAPAPPAVRPSLFIGGFAPGVTQRDIEVMFGIFGTIQRLVWRGTHAFLDYDAASEGANEAAVERLHGHVLDGKHLAVRIQDEQNKRAGATPKEREAAAAAAAAARYQPYPTTQPAA
eukprot:TRINITY_DN14174_c0_g1_i1.p1 TRINITY_DN14174_c0_g1~~TRINITY_DN14174_c0_g1_i1.p1  ORF type:complete len:497 (+),score=104.10 TRINITY_DN14174_c0_g1_i1:73-1491(+)